MGLESLSILNKEPFNNINFDFLLSHHEGLYFKNQFGDAIEAADIIIPESPGYSNEDRFFIAGVSQGLEKSELQSLFQTATTSHFKSFVHQKEFELSGWHLSLYDTHKPVLLIDIPKHHPLYEKIKTSLLRIQSMRFFSGSVDNFCKNYHEAVSKFSSYQADRDIYMLSRIVSELRSLDPALLGSQKRCLVQLGPAHDSVLNVLSNITNRAARLNISDNVNQYDFQLQAQSDITNNSPDLYLKVWLQNILVPLSQPVIAVDENISMISVLKTCFSVISRLSLSDLKSLFLEFQNIKSYSDLISNLKPSILTGPDAFIWDSMLAEAQKTLR